MKKKLGESVFVGQIACMSNPNRKPSFPKFNGVSKINNLFLQWEWLAKAEANHNFKSLYHEEETTREIHGQLLSEVLADIVVIQKRLVRALLAIGQDGIGELQSLIEVGTLPRFAIQAACGKLSTVIR